jgi:hypothetical protein
MLNLWDFKVVIIHRRRHMYAIAVRQADGRIKVEMGDEIHLDPVNGGFVSLYRFGSSVGFPIGQIECVANSSQFNMLTENQKKAIALGKLQEYEKYRLTGPT